MKWVRSPKQANLGKGLITGLVGGLVGAFVMTGFQSLMTKLSSNESQSEGSKPSGGDQQQDERLSEVNASEDSEDSEPSTEKAASAISERVFHHKLTEKEKGIAGEALHYAMGATSGALYGMTAEFAPEAAAGRGLLFGTALWLIADEAVVPAVGLSKTPAEYPLSKHAYALASHLVYGFSTDFCGRVVRKML